MVPSCYQDNWPAWAQERKAEEIKEANATVESKGESLKSFLEGTGILQDAAEAYVIFPDQSQHAVWVVVDKYSGEVAYWLLEPERKQLDVIWFPDSQPRYYGPNAELLRKDSIGAWLRGAPFPGNPTVSVNH